MLSSQSQGVLRVLAPAMTRSGLGCSGLGLSWKHADPVSLEELRQAHISVVESPDDGAKNPGYK
jgi:hypothetical protein